jgi:hypothetical protein
MEFLTMMHYSSLLAAVQGNWNMLGRVHSAEISNCITSKNMWNFSRMGGAVGFEHGDIKECRKSCYVVLGIRFVMVVGQEHCS